MKAKKYKHLSFEDRCIIEEFLNNNSPYDSALLFLGKNNIENLALKKSITTISIFLLDY